MKLRVVALSFLTIAVLFACKQTSGYSNEGTAVSPVVIAVGVAHQGTVDKYGTSYYVFLTAGGGLHTIALTNAQSDLSWSLWDTSYNMLWDEDAFSDASDEINSLALTAATTYYLLVDEWNYVDGTFTLTVTGP